AHRVHALGVPELRFELAALGEVDLRATHANGFARVVVDDERTIERQARPAVSANHAIFVGPRAIFARDRGGEAVEDPGAVVGVDRIQIRPRVFVHAGDRAPPDLLEARADVEASGPVARIHPQHVADAIGDQPHLIFDPHAATLAQVARDPGARRRTDRR